MSPRLGVTAKLSADGRTMLRASYGRFHQGVLTGELGPDSSRCDPDHDDGVRSGDWRLHAAWSRSSIRSQPALDPDTRSPRTDEYSIGMDREIGRRLAASVAYIRKNGSDYIGWTDVGGQYREETRTLPDGRSRAGVRAHELHCRSRFLLTNPDGYSLTYNGLVMAVEKRRSHGWQAFGSYTSRGSYGLQPSSGTTAARAQVSTVARSAFANHVRARSERSDECAGPPAERSPAHVPGHGQRRCPANRFVVAANLQYFSGKPWAATAQISLPQGDQRILLEPRGSRRLSSQSLLDVRLSRTIAFRGIGRIELLSTCSMRSMTRRRKLSRPTICSADFRTTDRSWIRGARCSE